MKQQSDFKITDSFLTLYNISYLLFCDGKITDSFLAIIFYQIIRKKLVPNYQTNSKNISGCKKRNGPITSTFGPIVNLTNSS